MKDRRLEQQIAGLDDFLERWHAFGKFFRAEHRTAAITPSNEEEFLRLKADLAHDHEWLLGELTVEPNADDGAIRVLSAAVSMKRLGELNEAEARALESEWHSTYIHFQTVLGRLKARKLQLASVSTVGYYIVRVIRSPLFLLVLLGVIMAGAFWLWNFAQPSSDNTIEQRGPVPARPEKAHNP